MSERKLPWLAVLLLLLAPLAFADTVKLKDGRTLEGTILGANDTNVTLDAGGIKMDIPKENIDSISMGSGGGGAAASGGEAAAPASGGGAAAPKALVIPAGTPMKVRLGQSVSSKGHAGQQFTGNLEVAITVQGNAVVPAGAKVIGRLTDTQRNRALTGKAGIQFELTTIEIDGTPYPIVTETLGFEAAKSKGQKTVGRAAKGAAVGALIDGSDGAKTGAKVGLGLSLLRGKEDIKVPAGTILDFRLYQQLDVN
jgi:hypothetical protein